MTRALLLVLLAACEHGQTPIETAIISPVRTPCVSFVPQMCLTMVPDQQPMERLFFGIEGYTHRWGVESEISLRREVIENPPADGPSVNLILIDIINENNIPLNSFTLDFPSVGGGWFTGGGTQLDMHGTTVQCDQALCDQLTTLDQSGGFFTVTMSLVDANTIRATSTP